MVLVSVGGWSARWGQSGLARWPRTFFFSTPHFINMQHGGRIALHLIALIGQARTKQAAAAAQKRLPMCCFILSSRRETPNHSARLCMSHWAPTRSLCAPCKHTQIKEFVVRGTLKGAFVLWSDLRNHYTATKVVFVFVWCYFPRWGNSACTSLGGKCVCISVC